MESNKFESICQYKLVPMDVRPAGRPDGRVRGLWRCDGGRLCGLLGVGYTGRSAGSALSGACAGTAVSGQRPTGAVAAVPRGSANRARRRRRGGRCGILV